MRTWLSCGSTKCSSSFRGQAHIECVAQLKQRLRGIVVAVAIANIPCGNGPNDGADEFDGQSFTVNSFDAHVGVVLRDAVGGKEAAIGACRPCRATVNKYSSRAANGASRSC
eukprot:4051391-Pleurochrysis_carterae.AAC.1